jgi:dipeptidyl aminopeptidase/acylaminoacyl peptidase
LRIVDSATGERRGSALPDAWWPAAWSPDGKMLAGGVRQLAVWSTVSGKRLWQKDRPQEIAALEWSPDGTRLAAGVLDKTAPATVWETATGKLLYELPGGTSCFAWSPDGITLAAGGAADHAVGLFDSASGVVRVRLQGRIGHYWLRCLRWSPDGRRLATLDAGRSLRFWEAASGRLAAGLEFGSRPVNTVVFAAWSPDGRVLARADRYEVHLSDADGWPLGVLLPSGPFGQLAVTADGHYRGNGRLERDIRIVVQKRDGASETLPPADFERRYGWQNDPQRVRLLPR